MRTIVKFITNRWDGHDKVFSKTLGKASFIDKEWLKNNPEFVLPEHDEFWVVDIIEEIRAGKAKGSFIIIPLERIEGVPPKLAPGFYAVRRFGGIVVIEPMFKERQWIFPKELKSITIEAAEATAQRDIYATIVDIYGEGLNFKQNRDREKDGDVKRVKSKTNSK